jgi:asparagine synthase (glutamine-hydrolysing)
MGKEAMCGICGFIGEGQPDQLEAMMELLRHRGPDAGGRFIDPQTRVFLGHRRLSILDIEGGAQPMWNEDGQIGVVFNGEIYNFDDLRRELTAAGHRFASDHSDTEVLVHGFEEWGINLPSHLNGMFAFAILDRRQNQLFLARDRFGEKPLYYTVADRFFAFASELRALAAHPRVDTRFDPRAVKKFLAYGYIPAPRALWRNTKKLMPGGYLLYDVRSHVMKVGTYWQFHVEPSAELARASEDDLAAELRRLLSQAVRRRLVSDVPLGVFLSGGVDSSAILHFASEVIPLASLETYSIGFKESSFDESAYARAMAERIGSQHHERILDMTDAQALLTSVLGKLDEPLGDPSILPTYLLAKFARERITVALSGDGGDELFAGYDPFQALNLARIYSRLVPQWLHGGIRRLIDVLPVSTANMSMEFKLRRTLRGLSYPRPLWNSVWLGPLEPRELDDLMQEPVDVADLYSEAIEVWHDCRSDNLVDHTLDFYTRLYLSNDILVKADRASMLNSLEVRAPFLDNDLVEFARRLPASMKTRRGHSKYLLKRALAPLLPHEVIYRKKKGFGIPLAAWLREWHDVGVRRFLDDPGRDGMAGFDGAWIAARWDEHRQGRRDHRLFLWSLLALMHHQPRAALPSAQAA